MQTNQSETDRERNDESPTATELAEVRIQEAVEAAAAEKVEKAKEILHSVHKDFSGTEQAIRTQAMVMRIGQTPIVAPDGIFIAAVAMVYGAFVQASLRSGFDADKAETMYFIIVFIFSAMAFNQVLRAWQTPDLESPNQTVMSAAAALGVLGCINLGFGIALFSGVLEDFSFSTIYSLDEYSDFNSDIGLIAGQFEMAFGALFICMAAALLIPSTGIRLTILLVSSMIWGFDTVAIASEILFSNFDVEIPAYASLVFRIIFYMWIVSGLSGVIGRMDLNEAKEIMKRRDAKKKRKQA